MNTLALSSSPRKDGNSRMLAQAVLDGAASRGHHVELADLADSVRAPLRDCRVCRRPDGGCAIEDGYEPLVLRKVLPADALVLATPLYWYGVAGQLKIFIDRLFCYIKSDYPDSERFRAGLVGKKIVLVVTSEESYPGAIVGITAEVQELARYLHCELVGVLRGIANSRGEIERDPARPLDEAYALGARLFDARGTDHRIDSPRSNVVWPAAG